MHARCGFLGGVQESRIHRGTPSYLTHVSACSVFSCPPVLLYNPGNPSHKVYEDKPSEAKANATCLDYGRLPCLFALDSVT